MLNCLKPWSYFPALPEFFISRVKKAIENEDAPSGILDVGGGDAPYANELWDGIQEYTVLEPSQPQSLPDGVKWNSGDAHNAEAAKMNGYGVVLAFMVLEHMRDPWLVMRNISRWMKTDGVVIISVPQYWRIHGHPSDYHRFTIHGVHAMAQQAGLKVIDSWSLGGPFVLVWTAFELASAPLLRLPVISQVFGTPTLLTARLLDWLLHRGEVRDTVGWMAILKKEDK
jgi:SAM-dependent methyltransferase